MPNDLGITSMILRLAERPEGVSQRDATKALGGDERTTRSVQRTLYELSRSGRLHKAGPHMHSRWFIHEAHAQRYGRETGKYEPNVRMPRTLTDAQRRGMHQIMTQAPKHVRQLEGEPIITSATRVTIAPPPRSRYQVDEAPRVVDSQQCRPWAKEAVR
jgi:hypothetical protein